MNILIIGTSDTEQTLVELCLKSRFLDKLYIASKERYKDLPNIEYNTINELIYKAKALQIDLALTSDISLIEQGLADLSKKNLLNVFAVNQKWLNLETNRLVAKKLMEHYSINTAQVLKVPLSFPVVLKTNSPKSTQLAYSMKELVEKREQLYGEDVFLEEYLEGEIFEQLSIWDGANLLSFPIDNLTEVQQDRLELYNTKLNFMLSDEKADFSSFFISRLIWAKNDWYVLEYIMHLNKKSDLHSIKSDLLYILNSAIYQKLNEF